ncbi:MAG TPA: cyclic nucleotide-binding domain-containing protein, partial [Bacteroidia bacterium]|nr:cyclic nucleotide-binding domain-containing protein [Bacteroidia bacterium]
MNRGPISQFMEKHYLHFNAAAMVDAAKGYEKHLLEGGKMMVTLAGAMSTAELGKSLAEMIRQGKVDIIYGGALIDTVGQGGIIGEMALIGGEPRSATAVARTGCALTPIDERRFETLVQEAPYFAVMVMRVLVRRLRRSNELAAAER